MRRRGCARTRRRARRAQALRILARPAAGLGDAAAAGEPAEASRSGSDSGAAARRPSPQSAPASRAWIASAISRSASRVQSGWRRRAPSRRAQRDLRRLDQAREQPVDPFPASGAPRTSPTSRCVRARAVRGRPGADAARDYEHVAPRPASTCSRTARGAAVVGTGSRRRLPPRARTRRRSARGRGRSALELVAQPWISPTKIRCGASASRFTFTLPRLRHTAIGEASDALDLAHDRLARFR